MSVNKGVCSSSIYLSSNYTDRYWAGVMAVLDYQGREGSPYYSVVGAATNHYMQIALRCKNLVYDL
jgi:hypothetical protein